MDFKAKMYVVISAEIHIKVSQWISKQLLISGMHEGRNRSGFRNNKDAV